MASDFRRPSARFRSAQPLTIDAQCGNAGLDRGIPCIHARATGAFRPRQTAPTTFFCDGAANGKTDFELQDIARLDRHLQALLSEGHKASLEIDAFSLTPLLLVTSFNPLYRSAADELLTRRAGARMPQFTRGGTLESFEQGRQGVASNEFTPREAVADDLCCCNRAGPGGRRPD
jgi:hypothetical protein